MSESKALESVKKVIVDQLGVSPDKVLPSSRFVEDLGADSLDIVELVMALEEEFKCDIPDEEAEKIKKVEDAVAFIESKLASS